MKILMIYPMNETSYIDYLLIDIAEDTDKKLIKGSSMSRKKCSTANQDEIISLHIQ